MNRFEPTEEMKLEVEDDKFSFSFTYKGETFVGRNIGSRHDLTYSFVGWLESGKIEPEMVEEIFSVWQKIPCVDNLIRSWPDDC